MERPRSAAGFALHLLTWACCSGLPTRGSTARALVANGSDASARCVYVKPSSPHNASYRTLALSVDASRSPWEWPVSVPAVDRFGGPVGNAKAFEPAQYASVVQARELFGRDPCRSNASEEARRLDALAGEHGMLAVAYLGVRHHSLRYGHIFDYIHAYYCALARPRAESERARALRVFLPAGMVACSQEHIAALTLFGSARARRLFGFTLERAPWVPSCVLLDNHCYAHGGLPPELRGRVTLLDNFPIGPGLLGPAEHARFRAHVHDALGLGAGPPMTILYVRSSRWPTLRSVAQEERVVAALGAWAAAEHPGLRFVAAHVHELSYADEVAAFADARVLISLWGSALHNCRYMRAGSVVVELYGALDGKFGDTAVYSRACAESAGLAHAPFPVAGAYPRRVCRSGKPCTRVPRNVPERELVYEVETDNVRARVQPSALVAFMRRVFPADQCALPDWASVLREYAAFLGRQPHPRTNRPLGGLSRSVLRVGKGGRALLPRQYNQTPWCRRRRQGH